jgi:hypothetical protein
MPKPTMQQIVAYLNNEEADGNQPDQPANPVDQPASSLTEEPFVIPPAQATVSNQPIQFKKITINSNNSVYIDALTKAMVERAQNKPL